jgi:hypothetical protein
MKKCNRCGETKSLEDFNKKTKNRVQSYCKVCQREYGRIQYHKNREVNAEKQRLAKNKRMDSIKADVRKLKEENPCHDCDMRYPHYVMDYDHVVGKKTESVSEMIRNGAARWKIFSEIAKCELVCSNCHRKRTFTRSGLSKVEEMV